MHHIGSLNYCNLHGRIIVVICLQSYFIVFFQNVCLLVAEQYEKNKQMRSNFCLTNDSNTVICFVFMSRFMSEVIIIIWSVFAYRKTVM